MCKIDLVKSDGSYYDDAAVKAQVAANPKWAQELASQKRTIVDNKPAPAYTYTVKMIRVFKRRSAGAAKTSTCKCWPWWPPGAKPLIVWGRMPRWRPCRRSRTPPTTTSNSATRKSRTRRSIPIARAHVMTTDVWLGQRPNCVDVALELDAGADLVRIETPIMHQAELDEVSSVLSTTTISTVYDPSTESRWKKP